MGMQYIPGLDREEPELVGYEEDIPTPSNDEDTREDPQVDEEGPA